MMLSSHESSVPDNDHTRVSLIADGDERVPHTINAVTGDEQRLGRESSLRCDLNPLLHYRGCLFSRPSLQLVGGPGVGRQCDRRSRDA